MTKENHLLLLPRFQKFINASRSGRRLTAGKKKISMGTIVQYRCISKLIKEFEEESGTTIRILLLKKQSVFLLNRERKYWSSFFKKFCDFLYKQKLFYDQYVASVLKVLRTFFNYLQKEKHLPLGNFHHQFRIPLSSYAPVVLEPHQLKYLMQNHHFEQSLPKHLKRTKDIFIFGCTVGLRFSDLMKLKKNNIITSMKGMVLQVIMQKTGAIVHLPVPPYLHPIIEKYQRKAGTFILPRLSNVNFNLQVKELICKAGWTFILPKFRHRQGKAIEIKSKNTSLRFCDQISSHTMRRTAITTLLILGVPEQAVRKISGHAPGSREFYKYISLAEDYVHNHVRDAYDKLWNS